METKDFVLDVCEYPLAREFIIEPYQGDIEKHGDHDQSTHGSWASGNFDEETKYEGAYLEYSEKFGIDAQGNYAGTTGFEANAVLSYSGNGYKNVNYYARGLNETASEIALGVAVDTVMHNPDLMDAAIENYSGDTTDSTAEMQEAIYQYVDTNGPKVMQAFRDGKTEEAEQAQRTIQRLDEVIEKSPNTFGGNNLYRVFADDVLANLQEGDTFTDKGFLSTSRIDLTASESTRDWLGRIESTPDTVAVILPNESKSGKGLALDIYKELLGEPAGQSTREKEILLPRNTPLQFKGYKTNVGTEARIAVFQRMDK